MLAVLLAVFPAVLGGVVGVVGMVGLGLAVLTSVLATFVIVAQRSRPLGIFRVLGLRTTPMITLLLLAAVTANVLDRSPDLHVIRQPSADRQPSAHAMAIARRQWQNSSFANATTTWLNDPWPADCAIATGGRTADGRPLSVEPMVLVAAEGGGIRAAWWTVDVMSRLTSSPCGTRAVFAASTVSGSSLGLAVMLADPHPMAAVGKLADEQPLAETVDGLTVRDTISGFTGIDLRNANSPATPYPDRAGLLEQAWEQAVPALAYPFPLPAPTAHASPATPGTAQVPWVTIFNSTSARTGCRVLISNIDLRPPADQQPQPDTAEQVATPNAEANACDADIVNSTVPGSYDLFANQPCLIGIRTSTAALLSGRFPFVTPSGVIDNGCDTNASTDQLIDGGYSENSGVASLEELTGQFMPAVRAHNARALAATGTSPVTVVVPMLLSVDNTPRVPASAAAPAPPVSEPLVPPLGWLGGHTTMNDPISLTEQTVNATEDWMGDCPSPTLTQTVCDSERSGIPKTVAKVLPSRAVTVAPVRAPVVAAPLGWAMSQATRDALNASLDATVPPCPTGSPVTCALGEVLQIKPNG